MRALLQFVLIACLAASAQERTFDKPFIAQNVAMLGATVFDVEVTHNGLGHSPHCVEGNSALPQHPSRGELYSENLIPVAAVFGFEVLAKKAHVPGARWITLGMASYATGVHVDAGAEWLGRCW